MKLSVFMFAFAFICAQSACQAAITDNLQGYWEFDGNGQDSSGNNRDFDLVGGPTFGTGLFGQALSLTGNTSQYAIGQSNETIFDLGADDFTIQAWANFNSLAGEQTLLEKFTGGAGPGYTVTKLSNNRIQFFAGGVGAINSTSTVTSAGNWNHVIVRRDQNQFEIFLNGSSAGTLSSANAVSTSPMSLLAGERDGGQAFPVNGRLDEYAFWDRSLSNNEITTLFNGGAGTSITAIPEPAALPILLTIAIGCCFHRRRTNAVARPHLN